MSRQPVRLARLVREYRQRARLTQREVAKAAGISVASLRDIEQDRVSSPRTATLYRLAEALRVSSSEMDDLVRRSQVTGRADLWIGILGPVSLSVGYREIDLGSVSQRTLLGLLALFANTPVDRMALVEAVFGPQCPGNAVELLQTHVSRLRRRLHSTQTPGNTRSGVSTGRKGGQRGQELVVASYGGYQLNVGPGQLDLLAFRGDVEQARAARADRDAARAVKLYEQAVGLWQGSPVADLPALHTHPAVVALVREWHTAILEYADLAAATPDPGVVIPLLRQIIVADPLHEAAHARLMTALAATGQQAAALTLFTDLRARLVDELGADPSSEVTLAHQRILRGEIPIPTATTRDTASPRTEGMVVPEAGPRQLPADVARFTGRVSELKALQDLLPGRDHRTAPATVVIEGMGGVGKTALAVHFAHQVAARFPDGQLYVDLRGFGPTRPSIPTSDALRGFLDGLGVAPNRIPRTVEEQAALYRSLLTGRRVLVLLDNAVDLDQVRPLLPASPTCMVIITSRRTQAGLVALEGAHPLVLDVLNDHDATTLLAGHLGAEPIAREPTVVRELIQACARLPLALSITAARAATNRHLSLTALAAQLRDTQARLDTLTTGDDTADIRAVFHWSYQALTPEAARLFRLCGLHPGPDITTPAAASLTGLPPTHAHTLLTDLTRAHLLTEHAPGRYVFHDLLRAYALDQTHHTDPPAEQHAATRRLLDHYLHTAHTADKLLYALQPSFTPEPISPGVTPEEMTDQQQALAWFNAEHQALLAIVREAATGFDTHAWQIPWAMVTFLSRRGHWPDLVMAQRIALDAAERQGDTEGQAGANLYLGLGLARLGDPQAARPHLYRGAELFAELDHAVGQAEAHYCLGLFVLNDGDLQGAVEHAHQALTLFRTAGYQVGEARSLNAIGWCDALRGNYDQALDYCQRSLELSRELGYQRNEAMCWDSLGYIHHQLGNSTEALEDYQHALTIARQLKHIDQEAAVLDHIGDTHAALGDTTNATTAWQQALTIYTELNLPTAAKVSQKLAPDRPAPPE